jgi:S1-C subfamily serine protease
MSKSHPNNEINFNLLRSVGLQLNADTTKAAKNFNFLADVVEKASPSVVSIERKEQVSLIFGAKATAVASGSGFIISKDGLVITNAHVVGKSSRVRVRLQSGEERSGRVLDLDEGCDLALVKVDVSPGDALPWLQLGSSSKLRPGEWVVAMGSPLTLSNTITAGIVSCVHRASKDLGLPMDMNYVQTDASITKGNSGGPLVNLDGSVVGVNTLTAAPGISFAIPSDTVSHFVEKANKDVETSKISEKYVIGVSMVTLRILQSLSEKISLPENLQGGVFVAHVVSGEPGDKGGLKRGDIIVSINGKAVKCTDDVIKAVQKGEKMDVTLVRKNKRLQCVVIPQLTEY